VCATKMEIDALRDLE